MPAWAIGCRQWSPPSFSQSSQSACCWSIGLKTAIKLYGLAKCAVQRVHQIKHRDYTQHAVPCKGIRTCDALLAALIYWPHTLVPQSLPSSEKSGMPSLDSLFTPPYAWLQKDAHSGNVQRSLTSGSRATVTFNGHVHRSQPAGGCVCMWRVSVVDVLWCRALFLVLESSSVASFEIVCLACVQCAHPFAVLTKTYFAVM
jgi:hypothetical protein